MIKHFIAKKILGLKVLSKENKDLFMPKYEVLFMLDRFYREYDKLSPSRNGISLTKQRLEKLKDKVMDYKN